MSRANDAMGLADILDRLVDESSGQDQLAVADIHDAVASRSYGPLIFLPALILASPLGAIPMLPAVLGVLLFSVSVQMLVGKSSPWLPRKITEQSLDRERFLKTKRRIRPWLSRLDRVLRPRLEQLFDWPVSALPGAVCVLLSLAIIPLGFIPGAIFVPALGLCFYGAALLARDGLVALLGTLLVLSGGFVIWHWLA